MGVENDRWKDIPNADMFGFICVNIQNKQTHKGTITKTHTQLSTRLNKSHKTNLRKYQTYLRHR